MKKKNNVTYIIAEIGSNHNGSFRIAANMIKRLYIMTIMLNNF